jgi:hypothetical protein
VTAEAILATAQQLVAVLSQSQPDHRRLVDALGAIGELHRLTEALGVTLAGEVVEASDPALERPLTRVLGERSPEAVLQAYAGLDAAQAYSWCRVGAALRPRTSLLGEPLPARHEAVTAGLGAGRIRVAAAARILEVVSRIEDCSTLEQRQGVERFLVEQAPMLSERGFARVCASVEATFQPEDLQQRDEQARRCAGVEFRRGRDGLMRMIVSLHPEAEGFLRTALDARTSPRRGPVFTEEPGEKAGLGEEGRDQEDPVAVDRRPLAQRRLDALVSIARESLNSDPGTVAGSTVTMRVTVALADLISGLGSAEIDGVDDRITASCARRLAADARIIPVVLGGASEPLDLGRSARLATRAQRDALALRDGGCAWMKCDAPPGWCEVAHVVAWAKGGGTDLANLMLLCPYHHRCFDNDGWTVEYRDSERVFIPAPWVDAARTPRRGRQPARVA